MSKSEAVALLRQVEQNLSKVLTECQCGAELADVELAKAAVRHLTQLVEDHEPQGELHSP